MSTKKPTSLKSQVHEYCACLFCLVIVIKKSNSHLPLFHALSPMHLLMQTSHQNEQTSLYLLICCHHLQMPGYYSPLWVCCLFTVSKCWRVWIYFFILKSKVRSFWNISKKTMISKCLSFRITKIFTNFIVFGTKTNELFSISTKILWNTTLWI